MKRILCIVLAISLLVCNLLMFPVEGASYMVGDISGDSNITASDLNLLKRYMVGKYAIDDLRKADVNHDNIITATDVNFMLRALGNLYVIIQPDDIKVDISEYTVVYPSDASVYEVYAAEILCDYVYDVCGIELAMVDDTAPAVEFEILIGNTNRAESKITSELAANQYMLKLVGKKLVLHGTDYMIGGAVGELTHYKMNENYVITGDIYKTEVVMDYTPVEGDNIILMIGDGMGHNQIAFTEMYMGKIAELASYNYDGFIAETFPNIGECTTYSLTDMKPNGSFDKTITDSAAAATALATGWKTRHEHLGVTAYGGSVKNIREVAAELGYKTAVIATEPSTGATPSGFTVHHTSRYDTDIILEQQQALVENGEITYLKGDSNDDLLADTKECLDILSTDSDGFFVMIEESYIDKACHKLGGDYKREDLAHYVYRFDSAIEYAATFTASRPGTVLIVTADHETGLLTINGALGNGGNHSDLNVPVFAMGYGTEMFNGTVVDNLDIARFMASIYGLEDFGGTYKIN